MASDPVAEALRAAERETATAGKIAAFLRPLPPGMVRWGSGDSFDPDDKPTLRALAGRVERAAQGERG